MRDTILFLSTNREAGTCGLADALLMGLAPDGGLFLPARFPTFSRAQLRELVGRTYPEVAFAVLRQYTAGLLDDADLEAICHDAYDFPVPLERVHRRRHLLRLDRGPTASFKDFAARMMARLMGRLVKPGDERLVILTATSGDTGSAVARAFAGVPGVDVVVLFPVDEVSPRQRRQMTTIGGNVSTFAVSGKFDDCQAMVKKAFVDPLLSGIRLSSANSINIGRLLPQSVYYVYSYVQLADVDAGEPIVFSVPCGNFGDLVGGLLAARCGVPVERFVVATNANDEVPRFFSTASYSRLEPSRVCISNAMNVGHPSNLARLVHLYGGRLTESGELLELPDMDRIRADMWAISIDDQQTRDTIATAWRRHSVLLEPHGAVGWAGLDAFFASGETPPDTLAVSLETAHPAKFPDELRRLTGVEPQTPPGLARVDSLPEYCESLEVDYRQFRAELVDRFPGG